MSFQPRRPRREDGTSLFSSSRFFWRGVQWQPLLNSATSFSKATHSGVAADVAAVQHDGPGVYELAITCKQSPHRRRIVVYCSAAANLRSDITGLVRDGAMLRGFLDHALRESHSVLLRCRPAKDAAAATAGADKLLAAYDYAWVVQPGGRARSLVVRQRYLCCGCVGAGLSIESGPPKYVPPRGELLTMPTGSKKR